MVIQITDYPVFLKLGYYDHERVLGQNVLVSLEVELLPGSSPGKSDDLDDTINYGEIVAMLDGIAGNREIKLVETVVELIGSAILERFAAASRVKVTVEKRALPQELVKGARISVAKDFLRNTGN